MNQYLDMKFSYVEGVTSSCKADEFGQTGGLSVPCKWGFKMQYFRLFQRLS